MKESISGPWCQTFLFDIVNKEFIVRTCNSQFIGCVRVESEINMQTIEFR